MGTEAPDFGASGGATLQKAVVFIDMALASKDRKEIEVKHHGSSWIWFAFQSFSVPRAEIPIGKLLPNMFAGVDLSFCQSCAKY